MTMQIAVDCMGGDIGPAVTLSAIDELFATHPLASSLSILAFGQSEAMQAHMPERLTRAINSGRANLVFEPCEQVVGMDESPMSALRAKRKSSMALAINAVKEGRADICVSAGNTGALVAISRYLLKTLEGIDRPAIVATLPTVRGPIYVLDLGANVDCNVAHLVQFAQMGTIMLKSLGYNRPKVGVLNIGVEAIKGNALVKDTITALQDGQLEALGAEFVSSIEANCLFDGLVDIAVCDGFVGNIALKTTEGTAHLISHWLKEECKKSLYRRFAAALSLPIWRGLKAKYDPRLYNGATLLGLQGVVVKSHGGADAVAFRYAIDFAIRQVQSGVNDHITAAFSPIASRSKSTPSAP